MTCIAAAVIAAAVMSQREAAAEGRPGAHSRSTTAARHRRPSSPPPPPLHPCSASTADAQLQRLQRRNEEWWSHSACPQQEWAQRLAAIMRQRNAESVGKLVAYDIGCNKGYTSAGLFARFDPPFGVTPGTLHRAIRSYASSQRVNLDRDCGVCGDCMEKPEDEHRGKATPITVHCFEPSPATHDMLLRLRKALRKKDALTPGVDGRSQWHIHKAGLHSKRGKLWWDPSCATDPGTELCTIRDADAKGAIAVDVVTVDYFVRKRLRSVDTLFLLKIDAEGYDAEVLRGANATLGHHVAKVVTWEYNPMLGGDKPRGPWALGENATAVVQWMDSLGYDCYLESNQVKADAARTPSLYRLNAGCLRLGQRDRGPPHRGWANVVCASRRDPEIRDMFLGLASLARP
eukprot:TRINITY_DN3678_c0_g1_i1.p1 TRINITY_DN3678_c0_g1~~TRINITY_DN3678_c0_g1_i1.p1  ORF type:complete len:403 (+),score=100.69 TRINITY_DN3678_c0_g1_i1:84-1292(+)